MQKRWAPNPFSRCNNREWFCLHECYLPLFPSSLLLYLSLSHSIHFIRSFESCFTIHIHRGQQWMFDIVITFIICIMFHRIDRLKMYQQMKIMAHSRWIVCVSDRLSLSISFHFSKCSLYILSPSLALIRILGVCYLIRTIILLMAVTCAFHLVLLSSRTK